MNFKLQVNRALIAVNAYFKSRKKRKTINKNVLIVFQQLFGDSILIQNSLKQYTKIFPREKGYRVKFLTKQANLTFMKETLKLPENLEYEIVNFNRFLESYKYYKTILKKYEGSAGIVIVPGSSLSGDIFCAASDAKRKIGIVRCIDLKKPYIMALFSKIAYTEKVRPKKTDMALQRHRKLINYLGYKNFLAELPDLIKKDKIIEGKYAVICPGASKTEKCWPIERFARIGDYLVQKYDLEIHLCGGRDERKYAEEMISKMSHNTRVISHLGETTFSDWSAIIQYAEIVVGNDSATLHLAAAARVRSVCLAGVYDKDAFFPYKVDKLDEGDRLPVTILKDMPCEWCRTIGYDAGYGNKECKERIDAGLCATCIDKITVDDVKAAIDGLMKVEKR